jgi:hypothetical protein
MQQDQYLFVNTIRNHNSAALVLDCLIQYFEKVQTVMDLGCGMGAWSKAMFERGFEEITLVDHPSLPRNKLLIHAKERFNAVDLDVSLPGPGNFDMIMCIEVLEHFKEKRALEILDFICCSTSLVLFSAAIPGQFGEGHINCQRHGYWHAQFERRGFAFYDGFKPNLLSNDSINYWIRQNLFIYFKPSQAWRFTGLSNTTTSEFELVHQSILNRKMGIKEYLKMAPRVIRKKQIWS